MTAIYPDPDATLQGGYNGDTHAEMHGRTLEIWENVKHWGAKGDGATDDTAAINLAMTEALAAGYSTLVFPPGTYYLADGSGITCTDIGVKGYGYANISVKDAYAFNVGSGLGLAFDGISVTMRSGSTTGGAVQTTGASIHGGYIRHMNAGGVTTLTTPLFDLTNVIGVDLFKVEAGSGPVGFYFAAGTGYNNANSMTRCRAVNANNANTVSGINAGVYANAPSLLAMRDCIFESSYNGYGVYISNGNHVTVEGCWFESNDKDNIRVSDSSMATIIGNKFHYNNGGDATARHIKLIRTNGAGKSDTHFIAYNRMQDASSSNIGIDVGTNVEYTEIIGNRIAGTTTVSDSGTETLYIGANSFGSDFRMSDGKNIILNTTTGTKIGTATNQKLAFYGTTPIVKQTGVAVSAAGVHAALVNLGLISA